MADRKKRGRGSIAIDTVPLPEKTRRPKKRGRGSVAIDTVPLPEKVLGMKVKKGRVTVARGKYYFILGRTRTEIPVGPVVQERDVKRLVGKDVFAAFSKTRSNEIVAIGTWPTPESPRIRPGWIVCYIPAPDVMRRVDLKVREALVNRMASEGIISQRLKRDIKSGFPTR